MISELNDAMARKFGFEKSYPVLVVVDTDENGAADEAGLSSGDLILAINDISISNAKELSLAMEKISDGDTVELKILRIGRRGMMQIQRQYTVQLKAGAKKTKSKPKPAPSGPKTAV